MTRPGCEVEGRDDLGGVGCHQVHRACQVTTSGYFVIGAEADVDWASLRGNYLFNCLNNSYYTPSYSCTNYFQANKRGVFGFNGAARISDLGDGLATTILVGEVRQDLCASNFIPHWGAGHHASVMAL